MTRPEVIATIERVKTKCGNCGMLEEAQDLSNVLDAFKTMESTAAKILGQKGGLAPVKPGSRPRGRPPKVKP